MKIFLLPVAIKMEVEAPETVTLNFEDKIALWVWLIKDTFVEDSSALLVAEAKSEVLAEYKRGFLS